MSPDVPGPAPEPLSATLFAISDLIERLGVVHMVVGAVAVAVWGRPRGTADVDVTVLTDEGGLDALGAALRDHGFDIDAQWLEWNPLLRGQHLRLIKSGVIVDLMRPRDQHEVTAIGRRREVEVEGGRAWVVAPEDLILMKLKAGRPRDFEDAVSVAVGGQGRLDDDYLSDWSARLGLSAELSWVLDTGSGS